MTEPPIDDHDAGPTSGGPGNPRNPGDADHPGEPGTAGRADGAEQLARYEDLGRVAVELLHDLASATDALRARVRLAAGEARMGRLPLMEMDRVGETADDLGAMLRDVLELARGAALSPEVSFDPRALAERTLRRALPNARPLDFRLECTLPPGLRLPGRESFLGRALANLLAAAVRRAQAEVRITLALEAGEGGRVRVVVAVDDDGPAPRRPPRDAPPADGALAAGAAQWSVGQLGGTLHQQRSAILGGTRVEVHLPYHPARTLRE